jgi:quercetin dioxygenase-like cupin family protein
MNMMNHANESPAFDAALLTRRRALAGAGAAGLLGLLAGGLAGAVSAQDATPDHAGMAMNPADLPPGAVGVTIEPLISGALNVTPGYSLQLVHFIFAPGATIAPHHHAGPQAAWVASGEVGYTLLEGSDVEIHRAPANGTPGPIEPLTPGVEVVLRAGDAYLEQGVRHWARNAGTSPADLYVAALYKIGEKGTTFTNPEGTPVS